MSGVVAIGVYVLLWALVIAIGPTAAGGPLLIFLIGATILMVASGVSWVREIMGKRNRATRHD